MWITVDVERVLRVDRGINVILCNPMLGSGGPQTLVLKLKGTEMTDELQRLRSALENIADWRNVNISGEYEHGLRDIIRSIVDSAVTVLDEFQVPHPAPQPARASSSNAIGWALWHPEGGVALTTVFASKVQAQGLLDRRPDKVGWKPVPVSVEHLPDHCASDQSKCGKLSWPWCASCPHAGFEPGATPSVTRPLSRGGDHG